MRILTLAPVWAGGGGLNTFNRELSIGLAEAGHHVTVRLGAPALPHPYVSVQGLDPVPGFDEPQGQLLRADGLPPAVDLVIGNGRQSGGAASYLREHFYPDARVVHIVHVTSRVYTRLKGDSELALQQTDLERQVVDKADLVVGVGPLLTEEAGRLARMCEHPPAVAELVPGIAAVDPAPPAADRPGLKLLMFGRAGNPIKGAAFAAATAGELRRMGLDVTLTVLGVDPASLRSDEFELSKKAGFAVKAKPFTTDPDAIAGEIRAADMVVLPALWEDFGLSAWETVAQGVPLMTGSHTGVGILLTDPGRVPPRLGLPSVVRTLPRADRRESVMAWAWHAYDRLTNLADTRIHAQQLRACLSSTYTWLGCAQTLVGLVEELPTSLQPESSGIRRHPATGLEGLDS